MKKICTYFYFFGSIWINLWIIKKLLPIIEKLNNNIDITDTLGFFFVFCLNAIVMLLIVGVPIYITCFVSSKINKIMIK